MKRAAAGLAACLLLSLASVAPPAFARAAAPADPDALATPPTQDRPPAGHVRSAADVLAIAARVGKVRRVLDRHPGYTQTAYTKGPARWQVSYFARRRPGRPVKEIAQVLIDDRTGTVVEAWTGFQVAWSMARGYAGAFGRKSNALYLWIPFCLLFAAPFFDRRRPWRLVHLDVLVLLAFSVSLAFFNHGAIGVSVPLAYPPLLYLLARMLLLARARARGRRPDPVRLLVPASWLAVGLIFLVGFRAALNLANSNVIDVGYAGVIGADRLTHAKPLYGKFPRDNQHGDTYGPANYLAYVPFELALPWSGAWDDLPAAHAAAIFFDALTMLLLWLLGRRIRGPTLGIALAYAWAAFPFTLFTLSSNSNDSLVAALVVAALLTARWAPARGAVAALAGLTKFAPLALVPLLATYRDRGSRTGGRRARMASLAGFGAAFALAAAACLLPVLLDGGLHTFYERTVGFQEGRGSPFSIYGLEGGLGGVQAAVKLAAAGLALLVAFLPRRRDIVTLAALAAAVTIAVQLGVTHWFYLYIVWFLPLVLVAMLGDGVSEPEGAGPSPAPARAEARSSPPAPALTR